MTFITLDHDVWLEQFQPITNPDTDTIGFDTHDDAAFVHSQPNANIWTLIDCPDFNTAVIVNGCWFVNRLEYYVTRVPHLNTAEYQVE